MLNPLLFVLALQGTTAPATSVPTPPTAAALVSRMFARYAGAKSLAASIRTTQTAGPATVVTDTSLAYLRPSKIRLEQRMKSANLDRSRLLVSDGKQFAYTPPEHVQGAAPFLVEPVNAHDRDQTVGDLYTVVASDLPDRSPVLDALVARPDDLKYFANQLAQFHLVGKETVNGVEAYRIEGDWRESDQVKPSAKFQLYIAENGDLIRYTTTQNVGTAGVVPADVPGAPPAGTGQTVTVVTTWDVTNVQVDQSLRDGTFVLKTN